MCFRRFAPDCDGSAVVDHGSVEVVVFGTVPARFCARVQYIRLSGVAGQHSSEERQAFLVLPAPDFICQPLKAKWFDAVPKGLLTQRPSGRSRCKPAQGFFAFFGRRMACE
jgi:hypothetical protein